MHAESIASCTEGIKSVPEGWNRVVILGSVEEGCAAVAEGLEQRPESGGGLVSH